VASLQGVFLYSLPDLHEPNSGRHVEQPGRQCQCSPEWYNYRPDSDLYIIYNVGTQFASVAPANPRKSARPDLR
jgi:hypothetical protein